MLPYSIQQCNILDKYTVHVKERVSEVSGSGTVTDTSFGTEEHYLKLEAFKVSKSDKIM
jgi:hypothetical protein